MKRGNCLINLSELIILIFCCIPVCFSQLSLWFDGITGFWSDVHSRIYWDLRYCNLICCVWWSFLWNRQLFRWKFDQVADKFSKIYWEAGLPIYEETCKWPQWHSKVFSRIQQNFWSSGFDQIFNICNINLCYRFPNYYRKIFLIIYFFHIDHL